MTETFGLIWVVLLLPIAGFLVLSLAGARLEKILGRKLLGTLAILPVGAAFLIGAFITLRLAGLPVDQHIQLVRGPEWINILGLRIPFELTVDPLSMTMTLIITGVGFLIFLYSTGYMSEEPEYSRFFTYLNLFVASMLLLVLGGNLPLLFVGWEGVGLCSYLLIGFWYKDLANAKAANKAFIVNRIGDWGLTLGIFLILVLVASAKNPVADGRLLSYDAMGPALMHQLILNPALATIAALLLFIGAAGKSAQFPLYLWLPDAMAGPTPVSALIHAATMVTSGVVLLNRMHVVFEASVVASAVVCGIGAFTAIFAAIIAFGQTDIKKVLAYSTVSQLGYMFIGCGAGAYWAGMFHVTTHAFFKALLFLGAGAVIHAMSHDQDMRHYGNLKKYLPITTWTMFIATWAIVALPPMSGYWSKEAILSVASANGGLQFNGFSVSYVAAWIGLITALLTSGYMTRLWLLTFTGKERWREIEASHESHLHEPILAADEELVGGDPYQFFLSAPEPESESHDHVLASDHTPKEVPFSMWLPLVVLAVLAAGSGFVLSQGEMFKNWLAPVSALSMGDVPQEPTIPLALISTIAAVLGLLLGVYLVRNEKFKDSEWSSTRLWIRRQFGFDQAMTDTAVQGGGQFATVLNDGVEIGLIDRIVNGLYQLVAYVGNTLSFPQKGVVRSYALFMLIGGLLLVGYMTFNGHIGASNPYPEQMSSQSTSVSPQP